MSIILNGETVFDTVSDAVAVNSGTLSITGEVVQTPLNGSQIYQISGSTVSGITNSGAPIYINGTAGNTISGSTISRRLEIGF